MLIMKVSLQLRRKTALERHFLGEELSEEDRDRILDADLQSVVDRTALWETFEFEKLTPDQQVRVAKTGSDQAVDYFLDSETMCPEAQLVLADRDSVVRDRLVGKPYLSKELRYAFLHDEDPSTKMHIAYRPDLTDDELAGLVCDSNVDVVRAGLYNCVVHRESPLGDFLLGSPDEEIQKLAEQMLWEAPDQMEISMLPEFPMRVLYSLPKAMSRDIEQLDGEDLGL